MSSKKVLNIEPIALATSIANLLNCAIASLSGPVGYTQNQPYILITHVSAMNKTASIVTVTCYKGATGASAAGTECFFAAAAVPANSSLDWDGEMRFDAADFLTGLASAGSAITLTIDAEIGISG
jgi:hypothetical protein